MFDVSQYLRRYDMRDQAFFLSEYNRQKKSPLLAAVLCLTLGGFGAHHFYLRRPILGVIYAVMFWTWVPLILAILEAAFVPSAADRINEEIAQDIATNMASVRSRRNIPGFTF